MALHDLQLYATESNWRLFMVRKADPAFLKFQQKVFLRDDHTCQFCGFRSKKHVEVINIDADFHHNRLSNLVTACALCWPCYFLEAVGKAAYGGGSLIFLPEMTQSQLNALCHVLFASIGSGGASAIQSRNIYRGLKLRSQQVEKKVSEGMSNPAFYGRLLIEADKEKAAVLQEKLAPGLRLLPEITAYAAQVKDWLAESLQALHFE